MRRCLVLLTCWAAAGCAGAGPGSDPDAGTAVFRGGSHHPGTVAATGVPDMGRIVWRVRTGGTVRSSPILVDSTLYVGSSDGLLRALDIASGGERWSFDTGAPVVSAAAVTGDLVVVANRRHELTALNRHSGTVRWRKETGPDLPLAWGWEGWDYFTSSPTVADGVLLFASGNGTLYALDPATGTERWSMATPRRFRATPAVAGGVVYIGGGDGIVRAIDLASGRERWTFETRGASLAAEEFGFDRTQIQSSAAVVDGVVYVGSRDASVYALDAATGVLRWTQTEGSAWVSASPAVTDSLVVSARSSSTRVHGLDRATGEVRWSVATGALVLSSPVVAGSTVYVANGGGTLVALDLGSGSERWRLRLGYGMFGTPAVGSGRLYVGDDDGSVYAIEAAAGRPAPRRLVYWDDRHARASMLGSSPNHRRVVDHLTGWGYQEADAAGVAAFMDSATVSGIPSVVVFAMDHAPPEILGGETSAGAMRRYLDAGGKVVWLGLAPGAYRKDPASGAFLDFDRARPGRLTGVDHTALDSDTYQVTPTETGRQWGLDTWWQGSPSVSREAVTAALAVDELGRAAAWAQSYGGPAGTGFVYLPLRDAARYPEIRAVAEYGVLIAPE